MAEHGKRVSWVELYVDLIFVLAVGQLAHLIVDEREVQAVWVALGLFAVLWWTWIGFVVIYNRHGADQPGQRLLFLAGSVPAGVAAVAIESAAHGDSTVFALSLAATRLVLAAANVIDGGLRDALRMRITRAYLVSATLFVLSAWVAEPWRELLWALGVLLESGALLDEDRRAERAARRSRDLSLLRPTDPREALDPQHFAERFGLFLIILLGEVLVEAGQGSLGSEDTSAAAWAALVAAMVLAAALWWLYFDSAAEINLRVLELSGGSPSIARGIFAVGHMVPSFSLLLVAAGTGLLLEDDPPRFAFALACVGIGVYLLSARVFIVARGRLGVLVRIALLIATFNLGRLHEVLSPHVYLWVVAAWTVMCALLSTRAWRSEDHPVARLFGDRAPLP